MFVCLLMMKPRNFQTHNEHIETACMLHFSEGQHHMRVCVSVNVCRLAHLQVMAITMATR